MRELNQRFTTRKSLRLVLAIGVLAASAVVIYQQSKRNPPAANQAAIPANPNAIQIFVTKVSGPPCQVTIAGGTEDMRHKMSLHLGEGKTQSDPMAFPGPTYTVDDVTKTRDGDAKPHAMKTALRTAEVYEIRIGSDDSIELTTASK